MHQSTNRPFLVLVAAVSLLGACAKEEPPVAGDSARELAPARPDVYAEFTLTSDLSNLSDDQRTMGCNLGVAIDDVAVGAAVLRRAEAKGLGTILPL